MRSLLSVGGFSVLLIAIASSGCGQPPEEETPSDRPGPVRKATVSEGTNIAATVSPDQSTIIMDLQGSLWSMPFKGGSAKQLTDPLLEPARPDFSPRGDAVAFQSYSGGTFHIWIMKPDGTGVRQLTSGHGDDRDPRFSPDGTRIAFSSDRAFKGSYDIWVVDIASGNLTQWTSSVADEYEPSWSPDGAEIAFVSGTGTDGTTIKAAKADAAPRTLQTAPTGAHFNSPSWSPDGKKLAYIQFAQGKSQLMVSGVRIGTGDDAFPFFPDWLPGNRLLYTGDGKIHVATLDDGRIQDIPFQATFTLNRPPYQHKKFDLDSSASKQILGIVSPALSPDGKRIVFEALNQLWVMDIGAKPRQLTNDKFYKEDPAWSPDGSQIAYSSDKSGSEDIYTITLATKSEKRLTNTPDESEVGAAWSRDGKKLAYQDHAGATYLLDLATGQSQKVIPPQFAPSKPSWSADGRTLAIAALKPYTHRFREGTSQFLTVDLGSGSLTYTEPAPFKSTATRGEDGPVYSPDGSSVAFVMDSVLWIRPVDSNGIATGAARQINNELTDAPTWSGDSKQLLYLSNGKLRMIGRDGSNPRSIPVDLTWHYEDAPQKTIVYAGRLWDGRGSAVRENVDIIIANHRIQAIEPHRDRSQSDAGAKFVDASNLTVVPGIWETHEHEFIGGKFYGDRLGRLWLAYGITTAESQGDPDYRAVETRESFGSGSRVGPRFLATGEAIDGERVYYNFMRPTMSEAQLDLELSRAQALDYDLLKTYVRLPHAWQKKAMEFAHSKLGVIATSHYMLPGMGYGMDGVTHVSATARLGYAYTRSPAGISYQDVRTLYEVSGMFDISTPFQSFVLYADDPGMVNDKRLLILNNPWDQAGLQGKLGFAQGKAPAGPLARLGNRDVSADGLKKEMDTVATILRHGGTMLAGTDAPLDNVATSLHLNLRAQVKYGEEPWQALQTATMLAAKAYGLGDQLGTVEPGKIADLTIVSGNPLVNIKDLANVQYAMKGGILYSVSDLMAPFTH
jgi:Tol biopolymer transport system component